MTIITEPIVTLETITPNAEELIARAYGICTGKTTIPLENIQKWVRQMHHSPLEHASCTFYITCSRVVLAEITRHRIGISFSVLSQRYVTHGEPSYFEPIELEHYLGAKMIFRGAMESAWKYYLSLLKMGMKKEIARYVLPNACLTEIAMTANFRELRHIIKLRASKHAQPEMQQLAKKILNIMLEQAPNVFADLKEGGENK